MVKFGKRWKLQGGGTINNNPATQNENIVERLKSKALSKAASAMQNEELAEKIVNFAINHPKLFNAVKPTIRRNLYEHVVPVGYNDFGNRIVGALSGESREAPGYESRDDI